MTSYLCYGFITEILNNDSEILSAYALFFTEVGLEQ